jgi:flagellar assembly protein FliH
MSTHKSVLSREEADKLAVAYAPRKFPQSVSTAASHFMAFNANQAGGKGSSFKIDTLVAEQTGMAELERLSVEAKVEKQALERLKDLQEQAYREAYALGLDEGREKAFEEKRSEFQEKVHHFEELISSVERLKSDLIASNEAQILKLVMYMAKRLAMAEVAERPELVREVIKAAVESAQSDESIVVRLSPSDMQFIDETRVKLGKEFEALKKAKFEASDTVQSGGCIVETNYGDVDATMEQRFEKLWAAVSEKLPKLRNVVGE